MWNTVAFFTNIPCCSQGKDYPFLALYRKLSYMTDFGQWNWGRRALDHLLAKVLRANGWFTEVFSARR